MHYVSCKVRPRVTLKQRGKTRESNYSPRFLYYDGRIRYDRWPRWTVSINDRTTSLTEREKHGAAFSFLRRLLSGWKNSEVILSHATNQLHFYRQLLYNFTLNRNITVHNMTNVSVKSSYGLINAESLLGGDTTSVHINYNHKSRH